MMRPKPWWERRPVGGKNPQIKGDRIESFVPIVMSKQTESSPFRFTDIAKEAGYRLRALLGHDRREALPDGQRLRRSRLRLR